MVHWDPDRRPRAVDLYAGPAPNDTPTTPGRRILADALRRPRNGTRDRWRAGIRSYGTRGWHGRWHGHAVSVIGTLTSGAPAQFLRFCVVGGIGYVTNLVVFAPLVRFVHMPYLLAACIAYACGWAVALIGHRHWTFGERESSVVGQGFRYFVVSALVLAADLVVLQSSWLPASSPSSLRRSRWRRDPAELRAQSDLGVCRALRLREGCRRACGAHSEGTGPATMFRAMAATKRYGGTAARTHGEIRDTAGIARRPSSVGRRVPARFIQSAVRRGDVDGGRVDG